MHRKRFFILQEPVNVTPLLASVDSVLNINNKLVIISLLTG